MTVALQWPEHVSRLIAVDNAPLDTSLGSKFSHYIQGMKKVEAAGVARRTEADDILKGYEEVRLTRLTLSGRMFPNARHSRYRSDSSFWETSIGRRAPIPNNSVSPYQS